MVINTRKWYMAQIAIELESDDIDDVSKRITEQLSIIGESYIELLMEYDRYEERMDEYRKEQRLMYKALNRIE